MGQYYKIIIKEKGKELIEAYDRTLDGEYQGAKLMEHSWYLNHMVNAICEKLYNTPSQIAWVGDYANEKETDNLELYNCAWGENISYKELHKTEFSLNGRYLINHSKKLILDCWEYLKSSMKSPTNKDGWVVHPLPLLTALGNGRGCGDYHGLHMELIGTWAWDEIEIVEWETYEELKKQGYKEIEFIFEEQYC